MARARQARTRAARWAAVVGRYARGWVCMRRADATTHARKKQVHVCGAGGRAAPHLNQYGAPLRCRKKPVLALPVT
jgi:hypothetical protein